MELLQNSVRTLQITTFSLNRSLYGTLAELTEVPGTDMLTKVTEVPGRYTDVVPVPVPAPGYCEKGILVPRVLCHGRTELTQVPGTPRV